MNLKKSLDFRCQFMDRYIDYLAVSHPYKYVWQKYRPAILKLMIDSAEGPQQYRLLEHEFTAANQKAIGRHAFEMHVHRNKATNDIRSSVLAKDLLAVLQESRKSTELSQVFRYGFALDKHFVLHVSRREADKEGDACLQEVVDKQFAG